MKNKKLFDKHVFNMTCHKALFANLMVCVMLSLMPRLCADTENKNASDEEILGKYIQSKGERIIVFDASNIKQYWIENTVLSKNNIFNVMLNNQNNKQNISVPLRIQLANVNEAQDCKVEIISETKDFGFNVLNTNNKVLSSSQTDDSFIGYSVASASFHLENTNKLSFMIQFNSSKEDIISIKNIILSFANNKTSNYLATPGELKIEQDLIKTASKVDNIDSKSFCVTGKQSIISSSKKILVTGNTLSYSVKIKNTGKNATTLYVGYGVYSKDSNKLDAGNYPYNNNNTILTVCSSSQNKIIVDKHADWGKNCCIAINAKADLSDIPNETLVDGKIVEFKKLEDGKSEITLNKPLNTELKSGTKIRIHGSRGSYFYTNIKTLQPGEEEVFTSSVKKDENLLEYSANLFPRGTYYVVPMILSYTTGQNEENTVMISDCTISY